MPAADHRFARAVQSALRGESTTIGASPQQSEKDRAVACARSAVRGGALLPDEVECLARQYLRELGLS